MTSSAVHERRPSAASRPSLPPLLLPDTPCPAPPWVWGRPQNPRVPESPGLHSSRLEERLFTGRKGITASSSPSGGTPPLPPPTPVSHAPAGSADFGPTLGPTRTGSGTQSRSPSPTV